MKKTYFAPALELEKMNFSDVLTTSGQNYPANLIGGNDPYMSDLGENWAIN